MLPELPWNAASTGSPTRPPPLPEITAKKIIPLHLNLPSYAPGTSHQPRERMSTIVKHPQPPRPAANENSSRFNLPDQADHGRLYKRASSSISKESTARSRRDDFSRSTLSFRSKRSHRDYFYGSPY